MEPLLNNDRPCAGRKEGNDQNLHCVRHTGLRQLCFLSLPLMTAILGFYVWKGTEEQSPLPTRMMDQISHQKNHNQLQPLRIQEEHIPQVVSTSTGTNTSRPTRSKIERMSKDERALALLLMSIVQHNPKVVSGIGMNQRSESRGPLTTEDSE